MKRILFLFAIARTCPPPIFCFKSSCVHIRFVKYELCKCVSHSVTSDSETLWTISLAGSSVHGFLLARILEWVAVPFSRGSSQWHSGKIFNMLLRWNLNNGLCDINNQEFSNNKYNCDLIIRKIIRRIIIWQISSHKIKLISR